MPLQCFLRSFICQLSQAPSHPSGLTELERANVSLERVNAANLSARLLDANAQLAEHRAREPRLAEGKTMCCNTRVSRP